MRASYKIADISSIISEKIAGIKIVKAFNMTKKEITKFYDNNFKFFRLQFRQRKLIGLTSPINELYTFLITDIQSIPSFSILSKSFST